jgi:hypothetical protein
MKCDAACFLADSDFIENTWSAFSAVYNHWLVVLTFTCRSQVTLYSCGQGTGTLLAALPANFYCCFLLSFFIANVTDNETSAIQKFEKMKRSRIRQCVRGLLASIFLASNLVIIGGLTPVDLIQNKFPHRLFRNAERALPFLQSSLLDEEEKEDATSIVFATDMEAEAIGENDDDEDYINFSDSFLASPLSQVQGEEQEASDSWFPGSFSRQERWLENATEDTLDLEKVPLGSLTEDDVETITGLMAAWVRRRSIGAALAVERLLKRVVDDLRAGNTDIHVTTRLYTIVSSVAYRVATSL